LARCFTSRSNPWHNDRPNVNFQRDQNLMIEADREYLDNPTLPWLCAMVAELIFRWERFTHESSRMRRVNSSGSAPTHGKHSKGQKSSEPERHRKDESKTGDKRRCHGCNRVGHDHDTCRMTDYPDFVTTGLWAGSATERVIRLWERDESKIQLPWTRRADGTPLTTPLVWETQHTTTRPPTPSRAYPPPVGDVEDETLIAETIAGAVEAMERCTSGTPCRTDVITHLSCNCGGTDINSTYRQCLVSTRPSTTFFTALTLFDTGAYT
jgi:hypothetical protein